MRQRDQAGVDDEGRCPGPSRLRPRPTPEKRREIRGMHERVGAEGREHAHLLLGMVEGVKPPEGKGAMKGNVCPPVHPVDGDQDRPEMTTAWGTTLSRLTIRNAAWRPTSTANPVWTKVSRGSTTATKRARYARVDDVCPGQQRSGDSRPQAFGDKDHRDEGDRAGPAEWQHTRSPGHWKGRRLWKVPAGPRNRARPMRRRWRSRHTTRLLASGALWPEGRRNASGSAPRHCAVLIRNRTPRARFSAFHNLGRRSTRSTDHEPVRIDPSQDVGAVGHGEAVPSGSGHHDADPAIFGSCHAWADRDSRPPPWVRLVVRPQLATDRVGGHPGRLRVRSPQRSTYPVTDRSPV